MRLIIDLNDFVFSWSDSIYEHLTDKVMCCLRHMFSLSVCLCTVEDLRQINALSVSQARKEPQIYLAYGQLL